MVKVKSKNICVNTTQALATAFAVYRSQGNRVVRFENNIPGNKEIVLDCLNGKGAITITEQDHEQAEMAIQYLQQKIMMSKLTNSSVSKFAEDISDLISSPSITINKIGQLVWAPKVVEDSRGRDTVKEDIGRFVFTSNYIGNESDKVELDFVPIDVRYLKMYNCYSHAGHDGKGNLILFLNKEAFNQPSRIRARIKSISQSRFHNNAKATNLNYVKAVK